MASGYDNNGEGIARHTRALTIWIWMAGVLAAMFIAVWMLSGEVRLKLL